MNYPIILQSFASDLNLYIPDPQKIQSVFEEQKAQNPAIDFPFWAKCWSSSFAMLKFLQNHAQLLDLGLLVTITIDLKKRPQTLDVLHMLHWSKLRAS